MYCVIFCVFVCRPPATFNNVLLCLHPFLVYFSRRIQLNEHLKLIKQWRYGTVLRSSISDMEEVFPKQYQKWMARILVSRGILSLFVRSKLPEKSFATQFYIIYCVKNGEWYTPLIVRAIYHDAFSRKKSYLKTVRSKNSFHST